MSLNCLEHDLALNCFLNGSHDMLQKAWNQNPFKEQVRRGCVPRTLAVRNSIQTWTSGVVVMQQACRCVQNVLYAVSAVEGLGGRPSIRKGLLARRAGIIDEELWGSQLDGWHLHMGGGQLGLLYDRGLQCGRELHPMREGPPLFTLSTQLTSMENSFSDKLCKYLSGMRAMSGASQ